MLICRNAEGVHGQRKVGNLCTREFRLQMKGREAENINLAAKRARRYDDKVQRVEKGLRKRTKSSEPFGDNRIRKESCCLFNPILFIYGEM